MSSEPKVLLTIQEAADRASISRAALYPLVMSGQLKSVQIGRSRRIPITELDAWVVRLMAAHV